MNDNFKDLKDLLNSLNATISTKIETTIEPVKGTSETTKEDFFSANKKWHKFDDIVVVFVDLEASTNLSNQIKTDEGLARVYNIIMGTAVTIFDNYDASFVDIQGDGGFAIFWGSNRYLQALVSAITIQTINRKMMSTITEKYPNVTSKGLKIGIASGPALVKKVGLSQKLAKSANGQDDGWEEPVWSGNSVNYAAKASQSVSGGNIVITKSVKQSIDHYVNLTKTCGCAVDENQKLLDMQGVVTDVWERFKIEKIESEESEGYVNSNSWCPRHGNEYADDLLGMQ